MSRTALRIGVGGHQNLGNETTQRFVAQRFRELLTTYQQHEQELVLYSSLAVGADQLFVQIARELGVLVEAVIPCAEYEANYATEEDRAVYHRLLRACHAYHQLPIQHCSGDAYFAAERWIIDQSDVVVLAWNGLPPLGRSGTADMATYARSINCPLVHLDTIRQSVRTYGDFSLQSRRASPAAPRREFSVAQQQVYKGPVLTVNRHRLRLPDGQEVIRDIVERPESVLILPVWQGKKETLLFLIEEYDLGAGVWQLKLPGGKVEQTQPEDISQQAQRELREETGFQAQKLEKLLDFYSHPGYVSHKVHLFIAQDLEWNPLAFEAQEEIQVHTYTLEEALKATEIDYRCDPEAALALLLYAHKTQTDRC